MATQAAYDHTATTALDCPLWEEGRCADHGIDAVAIAPYFGGYIADPQNQPTVEAWTQERDGGLEKLFTEVEQGGLIDPAGALNQSFAWMENYRTIADRYGLRLFTYEGGQHLADIYARFSNDANSLLAEANRDSRMKDIYLHYLNGWKIRGGELFMHFSDISAASRYGCWGALEYVDQNGSAKYEALMEYLQP